MDIEFVRIEKRQCALCGAFSPLTGEHKIKASLIRSEFGDRSTVISGLSRPRIAQSSKSRHFHFKAAALCKECNSSRTQPGDRAFDQLHSQLKNLRDAGLALTDDGGRPNVRLPAGVERDSFRYFAKLLCCFIVDVGGPRSKSISSFAIGRSERNPIFVRIKKDSEYEASLAALGAQGLARHGGLLLRFDDRKRWVNSIESSLSVGGVHYDFWVQLGILPKLELHLRYRDLIKVAFENIIEPERPQ